ncbi:DUF4192 domain-containing protein [Saccharothrix longispora]|uniref:DUF4192 domain-containing protein n=1 Tax=Saccharothrix longispora TaxID=33920 RepID=UPI0028FD7001|nr:DUF4192 domain-containing protein [Saccharothrix longispora]MDU0292678.1 DUF4192 domain-containing protein [Saccharothrix longispora]
MMSDPTPEPAPSTSPLDNAAPAKLNDPGDLIAAAPHLMGYYPVDALVVNIIVGTTVELTMCCDLPLDTLPESLTGHLATIVTRYPDALVIGVVVGGGTPVGHTLPRDVLVTRLRDAISGHDASLNMFWTPAITAGARWYDYDNPAHTGTVPDPKTTVLAVQAAVQGQRTLDSRADLAALLRPDPQDVLARRSAAIDTLLTRPGRRRPASHSYRLVIEQVQRTPERSEALSDHDIAALAVALTDYTVRDACIATATGEHAHAAEQLWTELTRQCPAPQRAEPAALLAMSAYLRGNGGLASLALDRAQTAFPGHRLTQLLRAALDSHMPPDTLRPLVHQAAQDAKRMGLTEPS